MSVNKEIDELVHRIMWLHVWNILHCSNQIKSNQGKVFRGQCQILAVILEKQQKTTFIHHSAVQCSRQTAEYLKINPIQRICGCCQCMLK